MEVLSHNEPLNFMAQFLEPFEASDNASETEETVDSIDERASHINFNNKGYTAVIVKKKEPTKLYLINHFNSEVNKAFDFKANIVHVYAPNNFSRSKQLIVICQKGDNDINKVFGYVVKFNSNNGVVSSRKIKFEFKNQLDEDGMTSEKVFEKLNSVVETSFNFDFKSAERIQDVNYTTFSRWGTFNGKDMITAYSKSLTSISSTFWYTKEKEEVVEVASEEHQEEVGLFTRKPGNHNVLNLVDGKTKTFNILVISRMYPNFRNSQAVGRTGLIEYDEIINSSSVCYSDSSNDSIVFTPVVKSSYGEFCVLTKSNKLFFPKRSTSVRAHSYDPRRLITFSCSGISDFCFDKTKLYVVVDFSQIYIYDNFSAYYDQCYYSLDNYAAEELPQNKVSVDLEAKGIRNYFGDLANAINFDLPRPDSVIEVSSGQADQTGNAVNAIRCFGTGLNQMLVFSTVNPDGSCAVNVVRSNQVIFSESYPLSWIKHFAVNLIKPDNPRQQNARVFESLLTIYFGNGTVIRKKIGTSAQATNGGSVIRNMEIERINSRTDTHNQIGRFLDI